MNIKQSILLAVIAAQFTTEVQACENETIIACRRDNMTCAKAICSCVSEYPPWSSMFNMNITCSSIDKAIPPGIRKDVNVFTLSRSNVSIIKAGTFEGLHQLNRLFLSGNNIYDIEPGAFVDLPQLVIIYLSRNKFTSIKTAAFKGTRISIIDLSENNITIVESEAFSSVPALVYIYLQDNNIATIERHAFNALQNLQVIYLQNNNITHMESEAFHNLPRLQSINDFVDKSGGKVASNLVNVHIRNGYYHNSFRPSCTNLWNEQPVNVTGIWSQPLQTLQVSLYTSNLNGNIIHTLKTNVFKDLSVENIYFTGAKITVIESQAFNNLQNLTELILYNNLLTVIEGNTFCNLSSLTQLVLSGNRIKVIKKNSFCNLLATNTLVLSGNVISLIEHNAFLNVRADVLVLGIDKDFVFEENVYSNFSSIYFHGNHLNCNCSFLWFILWLNERPLTKVYGFCSSFNNTTVGELAPDNFTFCYENNAKPMKCNILHPIEIMCTSRYITSYFKHWVHTKNGIEIRKLTGQFIDEDTNVLSIAFCSYEDVGDYTCVRTTNYSALTETALLTMKLSVYAAPIVLNKHMTEVGYDLVLSVVFYCDPYREPDWLLGDKVLSNGSEYIVSTCPYQVSLNQQLRRTYAGFISSLTILSYIQRPSTTYTCRINNEFGEVKEMMISRSVNIEIPRTIFCNTATTAEMKCTLDFSEAIPDLWIHSSGGQVIRSLQGTVVNNTNILILPFCNYQDMGDYMCTWRTSVPDLFFNKTITLVVNGSPILLKQFISMDGRDKVLSVLFFSQPFPTEPNWYFHGAPVLLGYDYQQTSVFSTVTVRQHRQDVIKQGFVSNLTIVNFKPQLHGDFTCKIVNDFGYLLLDFDVNEDPNDISHTDSSTIIIVSTCVFSIIVLTIIITVGVCKCRKRTKDRNMDPPLPSSSVPDVYDSIRLSRLEDTENAYLDAY